MQKNDRVIYIGDTFNGEIGIITEITDSYYIVKLNNGTLIKCLPQELQKIEDPTPDTITITREDFEDAVRKVVTPSRYKDEISDYGMITALCLSGELVCKKLANELFGTNG